MQVKISLSTWATETTFHLVEAVPYERHDLDDIQRGICYLVKKDPPIRSSDCATRPPACWPKDCSFPPALPHLCFIGKSCQHCNLPTIKVHFHLFCLPNHAELPGACKACYQCECMQKANASKVGQTSIESCLMWIAPAKQYHLEKWKQQLTSAKSDSCMSTDWVHQNASVWTNTHRLLWLWRGVFWRWFFDPFFTVMCMLCVQVDAQTLDTDILADLPLHTSLQVLYQPGTLSGLTDQHR